ncbi:MAG TPA: DUF488 domain-containing protein [Longimicrobiaceae bacterium]|nr:DUF488 domain-containing protein [Longimicrobiaceae bacterium]
MTTEADGRTVYTVGHSTRTSEAFVALLRGHGVELVMDVRRFPGSRRHPQFGSAALAASLAAAGIGYQHAGALGGRRSAGEGSALAANAAWRNAAFRAYADYMGTAEFAAALDHLVAASRGRATAIMCAEAVPWRCHRRLITDALLARGVPVADITGPGPPAPAVLSPHAVVAPDGRVTYPAPGGVQEDLFAG